MEGGGDGVITGNRFGQADTGHFGHDGYGG
jgi:hypothetical protein